MRKLFLIVFSIFIISYLPANGQNKSEVTHSLTKGKWINRAGGYIPNAMGVSDVEVFRNKIYSFDKDGTFSMDSIKQVYTGKWTLEGNKITMKFNPKNAVVLTKNMDPNDIGTTYVSSEKLVELGTRTAIFKGDYLDFGSKNLNAKYNSNAVAGLKGFWEYTGFANATTGNLIMILVALGFIYLAIRFDYEPLLLIPIGIGIIIGNIPFYMAEGFNLKLGIYEPGSVFNILYGGVINGWYPPLIFLGIGAMTDFTSLISSPRLMILGAAAQVGIFVTLLGALWLGFEAPEAGAIAIIGGADGPTSIFLSSKLANGVNMLADGTIVKNLIGPIAIAAYSYMALVPVIQPPVIKLLTTKKERGIKMKAPRSVSRLEKQLFPIVGLLLTAFIAPSALPLLGMLFFGNLLKESTVTNRLANTASNALIDIVTMLLGITVGISTQADVFLTDTSIKIFILGAFSFIIATAGGVIGGKIMNWISPKDNPVNPMIGAAGVSAVPDSARVVQNMGLKENPNNHLLMHAMAPNVSGVIGSAVAAGLLLSFLT